MEKSRQLLEWLNKHDDYRRVAGIERNSSLEYLVIENMFEKLSTEDKINTMKETSFMRLICGGISKKMFELLIEAEYMKHIDIKYIAKNLDDFKLTNQCFIAFIVLNELGACIQVDWLYEQVLSACENVHSGADELLSIILPDDTHTYEVLSRVSFYSFRRAFSEDAIEESIRYFIRKGVDSEKLGSRVSFLHPSQALSIKYGNKDDHLIDKIKLSLDSPDFTLTAARDELKDKRLNNEILSKLFAIWAICIANKKTKSHTFAKDPIFKKHLASYFGLFKLYDFDADKICDAIFLAETQTT